jgi:hypothetical protein
MSLTDKNPAKPGLKKLNPTVCCHLNLRDAGNLITLKISLHWPVKMPIISPLEIQSFQQAEAVTEQRHRREQMIQGHLIRPVNL